MENVLNKRFKKLIYKNKQMLKFKLETNYKFLNFKVNYL